MGSSTKSPNWHRALKELQVFNIIKAPNACGIAVEEEAGKIQAGQNMKNPVSRVHMVYAKDYEQAI